jgi:hypothetical protein
MSGVESGKAAPLVGGPPGTELQTVVEGTPSGAVGEMLPVAEVTKGVGMVPNTAPGVIRFADMVGVNAVLMAVVPGTNVGAVLATVDAAGAGIATTEGGGRGGSAGGCGAGRVVPGKSLMNEVAGCADSASAAALVVDVEATTGAANVVGAGNIDGADVTVITGGAGVPGVICPEGVAQVTTVPGVEGSDVSGSGASVVSGAPGWVSAENGLGPLSGED